MTPEPLHVLIVDDSALMRAMLRQSLQGLGARVEAPATLDGAREALGLPGGHTDVDVLLLDLVMPGTDGLTFLRELRAHAHLQDLSVIMVTALQEDDRLDEAFAAGANDYVTKPVRPTVLCARTLHAARLTRALRARREREAQLELMTASLRSLNEQLTELSVTDGLTGIANRRAFDAHLDRALSLHARSGLSVTLIMLDIDHFKRYNDTLGHPAGDACLQEVAALLRDCTPRRTDLTARYGGEEFALLLLDTDLTGGLTVARRVISALAERRLPHPGHPLGYVTVSLGVACTELTGEVPLREAADQALYRAKHAGRNGAFAWTHPLDVPGAPDVRPPTPAGSGADQPPT